MKRPSKIQNIDFIFNKFIPPKGFLAITFFGKVYIHNRNKSLWESYSEEYKEVVRRHETIHVRQAEMAHDSWFRFYMKYLWHWIVAMLNCGFKNSIAYYCIPYEVEAYLQEDDYDYEDFLFLYTDYQAISPKEYVQIAKKHLNSDGSLNKTEYFKEIRDKMQVWYDFCTKQ